MERIEQGGDEEFSLRHYLQVLRRGWLTIAVTLAVALAAAIVFSLIEPVSYEAEAVLGAQPSKYAWRLDTNFQTIAEDVRVDRRAEYNVFLTDKAISTRLARQVIEKLGDDLPAELRSADQLRRWIDVSNGAGRLVYLSSQAPSAKVAQSLVNAWADVWIAYADAQYGQSADKAKFAAELESARERDRIASETLRDFQARTGIGLEMGGNLTALGDGSLAAGMPILQQQLVLNNSALADYRVALARLRLLADQVERAITSRGSFGDLALEVLDLPLLVERGQLTRGAVAGLGGSLASLRSALAEETASIESTAGRLEQETVELQTTFAGLLLERDVLVRDKGLAEETLRALERKLAEIPIQQEVAGPPLVLLSPAPQPTSPATPNWLFNLGGGLLLGLLGGIVIVFSSAYLRPGR